MYQYGTQGTMFICDFIHHCSCIASCADKFVHKWRKENLELLIFPSTLLCSAEHKEVLDVVSSFFLYICNLAVCGCHIQSGFI
jgi:hypothetical protein